MNKTKFRKLESNFLRFGKIKGVKIVPKPVADHEVNEVNVLAYFNTFSHSSNSKTTGTCGISNKTVDVTITRLNYIT